MIKETIKYVDYNGEEREDDFYFHYTEAELLEMEVEIGGGMLAFLRRIIDEKDTKEILKMFKRLLMNGVGKKSLDGRMFVKNQEIIDEFIQSEAYSELLFKMMSNEGYAAKLVNGMVPERLRKEAEGKAEFVKAELKVID